MSFFSEEAVAQVVLESAVLRYVVTEAERTAEPLDAIWAEMIEDIITIVIHSAHRGLEHASAQRGGA